MKTWFIEGYFESSRSLQRVRLDPLPFTIGRTSQSDLMLDSPGISRNHARFFIDGGDLYVEDAGSTNGSYLNRDRLAQAHKVQAGDIVHFAETECRVVEGKDSDANDSMGQTRVGISTLSSALPQGTREFQQMLLRQLVTAHFQPIVYADGGLCAYEILGRGTHDDLPDSPGLLFRIAESLDLEVPFSELLRSTGLTLAASHGVDVPYFFNIHPAEMRDTNRLMRTLQDFRSRNPDRKSVV